MRTAVAKQNIRMSSGRIFPACAWSRSRRNAHFSSISATSALTYTEAACIKDSVGIDPCMGSGHILVYMFDVLVQIYEAYGYSARDAACSIVENNLYGLDIDERAAQLAYFSVMMKARSYDRRFFSRGCKPKVYAIRESNDVDPHAQAYFVNGDPELKKAMDGIIKDMHDAKEYGSIIIVKSVNFPAIYARFDEIADDVHMYQKYCLDELLPLVQVAEVLAQQYHTVVTNPPYMRNRGMDPLLVKYVKKNYEPYKFDLYAVFTAKCQKLLVPSGYMAMITQHSFMFLSRFEQIRRDFYLKRIVNMVHLGTKAFEEIGGEVVQTTSFVINKAKAQRYIAKYIKLTEIGDAAEKESQFYDQSNLFYSNQEKFEQIPGGVLAYWVSDQVIKVFESSELIEDVAYPRKGNSTSDNDRFLRLWFEVEFKKLNIGAKCIDKQLTLTRRWFPYNKGGSFRKWYGNNEYVVDWKNDAEEMRQIPSAVIANYQFFMKPGITWSTISGGDIGVRRFEDGYIFDNKGECLFCDKYEDLNFYAAYLNSKPAMKFLSFLSPTLDFNCGYIAKLPVRIPDEEKQNKISELVRENVELSKQDWDSFETSWDFQIHPLVRMSRGCCDATFENSNDYSTVDSSLEQCYLLWENECKKRFARLKDNEEEINHIFIEIYGLQGELSAEVEDKNVTVHLADKSRDIRSLISYSVGCMFGRYSLDTDGLIYAGGNWDVSKYKVFAADKDNIIPICDDEYFVDDIVKRFIDFIQCIFGKNTLEKNLRFIADALGGSGQPRKIIRNYFMNDFYADHCNTYSVTGSGKRPIYWLFDSGKKNGFKALIYMHRYRQDTVARIRTDYVHEQQSRYRTAIADLEKRAIEAGSSDRVKLNKQLTKIQSQADELRVYEEKIHHLADQMISINLDDGVKKNYSIFQDVLAKLK